MQDQAAVFGGQIRGDALLLTKLAQEPFFVV
jgi:hypothetical protein